jgi:hypothetical protein
VYPSISFDGSRYQLWWNGLSNCPQDYAKLEPGLRPPLPSPACLLLLLQHPTPLRITQWPLTPAAHACWLAGSGCPLDPDGRPPIKPPYSHCVCPVPSYRWPLWRPSQHVTGEWSVSFYANSTDGLHFTRPDLKLRRLPFTPSGDSGGNVVVWSPGADMNRGVLLDPRAGSVEEEER